MPKLRKKSIGKKSKCCDRNESHRIKYKRGYNKCCKPHPCVIERGTPICYPACPPKCLEAESHNTTHHESCHSNHNSTTCHDSSSSECHKRTDMIVLMTSDGDVTTGNFIGQGQDGAFLAVALVSPRKCKFVKLVAHLKGAILTTGDSGVFTLYINNVAQSLVVQIDQSSPTNSSGAYNIICNSTGIEVNAGDLVSVQFVRNGSNWTAPNGMAVSLVCEDC